MLQKLPVNGFEWVKEISQFNEGFLESYNEESNEQYFLEVNIHFLKLIFNILKSYMSFITICYFYEKQ